MKRRGWKKFGSQSGGWGHFFERFFQNSLEQGTLIENYESISRIPSSLDWLRKDRTGGKFGTQKKRKRQRGRGKG